MKITTLFAISLALLTPQTILAQTSLQEITENIAKSGSNYYAYTPEETHITKAPKGYKPFYISHYGRHGSRYLLSGWDFSAPIRTLMQADSAGVLSNIGKEVLQKIKVEGEASRGRYGDLTPLGAEQHKGIANRMYQNYPGVFAKNVSIEARSTTVIRCILSMEAFCQELLSLQPSLKISNQASEADMRYMNYNYPERWNLVGKAEWQQAYQEFRHRLIEPERLMNVLFTDSTYAKNVDGFHLMWQLMWLAGDMQNTPTNQSMFNLFTPNELFAYWQINNANWYGVSGSAPQTNGMQPLQAVNLLREITDKANQAIEKGEKHLDLRFGHDESLLPLVALMRLEGAYSEETCLDSLYKSFADFKVIPMAGNLQMIFFKKNGSEDILVKFLLNEREVHILPVTTDIYPFYHWKDVSNYFDTKTRF